ncbi:aminodeoxychorismate/anthranilate synthase component II [Helicobacter saguini]|uniref:Aminodeoxychorismate/anthranilate synthase component II n=1 Tax=Helicobacter saguini TaxID=1548018 RepID=A0A347VRY8_9HELI|nr:aminodeoxychorismate/anthranilate synthase component II [Helicobacter saguini]MWV62723.1 aminodeoxychorismate/anthranilate synthase component II [Helicobacter saguini]MWV66606.1 aminodeoxychorismate/anthranilate synthase component II [Helicobacter saguini]MWV68957.1 aminodeoxychorismate/anthranilate synthase component II [Helicobacter saguini]MWV71490.1 aminodeoxychorismate/anthranilate synthase component II [Helicobacter saguini]TLD92193.1 aminodeoxychorismate/anthranilate synthase compone
MGKYKNAKVLIIDNFDSFTYNIVYLLESIKIKPIVLQNTCGLQDILRYDFTHLIISPGPSNPQNAGVSIDAIKYFAKTKRILGICLGHQCIAQAFGESVVKMPTPTHAKKHKMYFKKNTLFKYIKSPIKIALYHSLQVKIDSIKPKIKILAYSKKIIMAIKVKKCKIYGIQFHPESILQKHGKRIIKNFLEI